jgi:hypothetical protein
VTPVVTPPAEVAFEFELGFAQLKSQLGPVMGDPTEAEHGNPDNCDTQQLTTTGLAYWRCSSNLLSFAAFPDGAMHWALSPSTAGLVEWSGDQDPPPDAMTFANSATAVAVDDPPLQSVCLAASPLPAAPCAAGDGISVSGAIQNSGDTLTLDLFVPSAGVHVAADLSDLPADYDMYLSEASGNVLAASAHEGLTPEHIDADLPGGTYYLYVHSDPGRAVDPFDPFQLQVSAS